MSTTTNNDLSTRATKSAKSSVTDLFLGIAPLLIGAQLLAWIFFLPAGLQGHSSFRQLYTAGYMVRTGHGYELYDYDAQKKFQDRLVSNEPMMMPFIRPPFDALAYAPLSLLSYRASYVTVLAFNIALLVLSLVIICPYVANLRLRSKLFPAAIFAAFVPVASALMMGQDSILLLVLLSLSTMALARNHEISAGMLAGLGLFKFHIVLPLAVLFLFWKRFRFFVGFSCVATILAGVSVWLVGPAQVRVYVGSLLSIGQGTAANPHPLLRYPLPVTMMPNIHGLVNGVLGVHLTAAWGTRIAALTALCVLLWVGTAVPRDCPAGPAVSLALTTSIFISYYLFVYDLAVLLLPLTVALDQAMQSDTRKPDRLLCWSGVLLFLAPAFLFFSSSYFYLVSPFIFLFLIAFVRNAKKECAKEVLGTT